MDAIRGLYMGVLAALLILAGCFGGGVIDDTDGQDSGTDTGTDDGTGTGSSSGGGTSATSYNSPPITEANLYSIEATYVTTQVTTTETTVEDDGTTTTVTTTTDVDELAGFEVEVYHAMLDWDGAIAQAGWDTNLDGAIDSAVTAASGFTTLQLPLALWHNLSGVAPVDHEYMITIAFGAQDDDGAWSDGTLLTLSPEGYFGEGTTNIYAAIDHPNDTTDGTDDALYRLSFHYGPNDLEWAFLTITLYDDEDGQTYQCSPGGSDCGVSEESADSVWGGTEIISLTEAGTDICGASGAGGAEGNSCTVGLTVQYKGKTVAGSAASAII